MNEAYNIYDKHKDALARSMRGVMDEAVKCMFTGKKPSWAIEAEKRKRELKCQWDKIKLNNCCHCDKSPILIEDINCGIDGGPSPITIHGLKIKCNCSMQTGIYNYRDDNERLEAYIKCSKEWNKLK